MSRLVLIAAAAGLLLTASANADNKQNIQDAKAAIDTLENSKDAKARAAAVAKLGALAQGGFYSYVEPGIPKVMSALDDKEPSVRAAAAFAIGQIGPDNTDTVVKRLSELLKDKDAAVKMNAVKGLGALGPKASGALKALREAKKEDGDPKSRFSRTVDTAVRTIRPKQPD